LAIIAVMNSQWYTKKWVTVSLHVLFWAIFFISPYLLRAEFDDAPQRKPRSGIPRYMYMLVLNNFFRVSLFYVNAFLFIPQLVYKRKYGLYLLTLLVALIFMLFCDRLVFDYFIDNKEYRVWNFFVFNLFPFVFIIIASTAFRMIRDRIRENELNQKKETENLKSELSFLRSQVSPHFMFNVLNNMVALARKQSDALEPSLIKLSSLLRYMLYETDEEKVLVEKEVEYLNNYIDLQRQRFGKHIRINVSFEVQDKSLSIEPMLLIPFVENAFKHGTGLIEDATIDINLRVENGHLDFIVKNRYNDLAQETRDKTSGIGLHNVRRRLNLLYAKHHSLIIEKKEGWFTVMLHLNLH
jgi:two-component system, LytTR family, sensor kinase